MQQCMELTSTNRPFGLIIEFTSARHFVARPEMFFCASLDVLPYTNLCSCQAPPDSFAGDTAARAPPVPIPNTEVKPRRA